MLTFEIMTGGWSRISNHSSHLLPPHHVKPSPCQTNKKHTISNPPSWLFSQIYSSIVWLCISQQLRIRPTTTHPNDSVVNNLTHWDIECHIEYRVFWEEFLVWFVVFLSQELVDHTSTQTADLLKLQPDLYPLHQAALPLGKWRHNNIDTVGQPCAGKVRVHLKTE